MEEKSMKIKSLVSIILVLILCLSTFLVSCTPKDNGEPAVNADPENPLNIVWPFTPQFKDMDVIVDGVLIIEDGKNYH